MKKPAFNTIRQNIQGQDIIIRVVGTGKYHQGQEIPLEIPVLPYWDRVLIERDQYVPTGVIIAPEMETQRNYTGTVIAVGPGRRSSKTGKHIPIPVNPGDRVLYGPFSGVEVVLSDKRVLSFFREEEIYAVIEQSDQLDPEQILPGLY